MKKHKLIISGVTGVVLGYLCSQTWLAHSWMVLIVWGIAGLIFGYFIKRRKETYLTGALYGSLLTFTYTLFGFQGTTNKLPAFLVLSVVIAVVGGICGIVLFVTGNWVRGKFAPEKEQKDSI